jgi:hypothetical protein
MTEEAQNEETDETSEIEVWEFSLDNGDIDDMIVELNKLKETKESFSFDIDEDNELLVHHDDSQEESEE